MIRNNRRAGVLAIAVLMTLATLALAPGVVATFPDRNGLIAFQAQTDNAVQIFTVRSNGNNCVRSPTSMAVRPSRIGRPTGAGSRCRSASAPSP